LNALDRLAARTIVVALPAFTLGIAAGLVRLHRRGGSLDVLMEITLVTWAVYGTFLLLRFGRSWQGRRIAYVALLGFVLVAVVRLALPGAHFS
jgi:ABC-type transport system involved in cytochrome c biogenesis permease subunit